MKHVIGIDASMRKTGISVLDSDGTLVLSKTIPSVLLGGTVMDRMLRIDLVAREIRTTAEEFSPDVACIEGYSFGSQSSNTAQIAEMGGLIRYSMSRICRLIEVAPSNLKKWATGRGAFKDGDKTPMIVALLKQYKVSLNSNDEYDAYALARMALQIGGFELPANKHQAEAIKVAVNGKPKATPKKKSFSDSSEPKPF